MAQSSVCQNLVTVNSTYAYPWDDYAYVTSLVNGTPPGRIATGGLARGQTIGDHSEPRVVHSKVLRRLRAGGITADARCVSIVHVPGVAAA